MNTTQSKLNENKAEEKKVNSKAESAPKPAKKAKKDAQPGRAKFYVEKNSIWVKSAVVFMIVSAIFRLIGCIGMFGDAFFAVTQIALPIAANLIFILIILTMGKRFFFMTSIPVLMGVVFFILKSFSFESWLHTFLCVILYVVVAMLYTGTAFGLIRTKWLLPPLFGLPFIYHIFVEDLNAIKAGTMSFSAGMQEMSVLCIMLCLFCTSIAMKKKKPDITEQELPKIKDPKVIVPQKPEAVPAEKAEAAPAAPTAVETEEAKDAQSAAVNADTGDSNESK